MWLLLNNLWKFVLFTVYEFRVMACVYFEQRQCKEIFPEKLEVCIFEIYIIPIWAMSTEWELIAVWLKEKNLTT